MPVDGKAINKQFFALKMIREFCFLLARLKIRLLLFIQGALCASWKKYASLPTDKSGFRV